MNSYPDIQNIPQKKAPRGRSSRWIRVTFLLLAAGAALLILRQLSGIVQLLVISALLAYLLDPFATWLESFGMARTAATFAVFMVLLIVLGVVVLFLFPIALNQLTQLQAGPIIDQLELIIAEFQARLEIPLSRVGINDLDLLDSMRTILTNFFRDSINYVPDVLAMLSNLVVVPFMMFFFLKDGRSMKRELINLVPNRYFEFSLNVTQKMDLQLGNYLRGQFLVAFIDGTLVTLALWLLEVDFFLVIGPLAGLANLIPYIGPLLGLLPAVLASLLTSGNFDTVPAIVLTFMAIQVMDSSFLQPLIIARNVELHPLIVLVAILIGGQLFGIVGLLLAVPFTAILKVVLLETISTVRRYRLS